MKPLILGTLIMLTTASTSRAQDAAAMQEMMRSMMQNPEQMEAMMKAAEDTQACMEKIGDAPLQRMEAQAKQIESEIQKLCASGQRKAAMNTAISYAKKLQNSKDTKAIMECSSGMQAALPFDVGAYANAAELDNGVHVCDSQ